MKNENYECEWETMPTVDGEIVYAYLGKQDGHPDVLHVKGTRYIAEDHGNLLQVLSPETDPDRPFVLFGKQGILEVFGYEAAEEMIGKRCVIFSTTGLLDSVSVEPKTPHPELGWPLVLWTIYY